MINNFTLNGDKIQLITEKPLAENIVKEFTEFTLDYVDGKHVYQFEPMPNMSFSIRGLLAKYKSLTADQEVLKIIAEKSQLATMPVLYLYPTKKHVGIKCPPLTYYLDLVSAVGAAEKGMNTYTVPIGRAFDVIRASESTVSFLPKFVITKELRDNLTAPIEGFDGTIASLFETPIETLKAAAGAYRVNIENFHNVGYKSIADFLVTQPRRYIDKTQITNQEDLEIKEPVNFIGRIIDKKLVFYKHAVFQIDVGGTIFETTYYQRAWMVDKFNLGDEVLIMGEYAGRGKISGQSIESLLEAEALDIVPLYSQSAKNNITSKIIMNVVYEAIERIKPYIDDLAPYVDSSELTMTLDKAFQEMHFPSSSESYIYALETLALYELIYLQLMIIHRKATEVKDKGIPKPRRANGYFDNLINSLPWELTEAQVNGLVEIDKYMSTPTSEQILLTADVGSGKSLIAQLACMQALDNGYQSVVAAPTEILAIQLYDTFKGFIDSMPESHRPTIALLKGKMKAAEKRELLKYIKSGDINIVVGTHAVLSTSIEYNNLGLIVIDEQQKFGKAQREALLNSRPDGFKPDLLAQTATPIPRSTAQAFYGDIDLISLDGKPKGRIEIKTEWIKDDPKLVTKRTKFPMWEDIEREVAKGHQAFVVVPAVFESKKIDSASVEGAYKDLKQVLKNCRVGFTHGQQKKDDQQTSMEMFRNGELDVLVASTVIEVGVDVPNATRVVILSADRLGASSLHQIRGRVGRSNLPSTCYLVSQGKTGASKKRLQALVDSSDGFEIAKVDLNTRGQGDLFGIRQAGESTLRFSNLVDHSKLVSSAQRIAKDVYNSNYRETAIKDAYAMLGQEEILI